MLGRAHPRRTRAAAARGLCASSVPDTWPGSASLTTTIGRPGRAVGQPDPGHAAALDEDPLDLGAQFDAAAQPFQEAAEGSHDRGGAPIA